MPDPYEEIIHGRPLIRGPINGPHELLCDRLHQWVAESMPRNSALRLLPRRGLVKLQPDTEIRPDLSLVRRNDPRLYLAVEVLQQSDRHPDTVTKKNIFAACLVPRLWIVDGRYQNIEIYVSNGGRFRLESILTGNDLLSDSALSSGRYPLNELFARRTI
jgi:Uma2 family endonuclease